LGVLYFRRELRKESVHTTLTRGAKLKRHRRFSRCRGLGGENASQKKSTSPTRGRRLDPGPITIWRNHEHGEQELANRRQDRRGRAETKGAFLVAKQRAASACRTDLLPLSRGALPVQQGRPMHPPPGPEGAAGNPGHAPAD